MVYVSIAHCKTYLGLQTTDDDGLLAMLIDAAQAAVDRYCNRTFEAAADTTRRFDAVADIDRFNTRLLYTGADLCQITSIVNGDGLTIPPVKYTTVPANERPWWGIKLLSDADYMWTFNDRPENSIAVTGRWAFSVTAPADVAYATLRLSAYLYRQRDTSAEAERPMVSGDGAMIMPSRIPRDVQEMLHPYRRLMV